MTRSPAATPVWTALLDAAGHGRDLLGHDLVAAVDAALDGVGLALEAALAATDQALGAGARLAGLRLATALEAAQGDPATGVSVSATSVATPVTRSRASSTAPT